MIDCLMTDEKESAFVFELSFDEWIHACTHPHTHTPHTHLHTRTLCNCSTMGDVGSGLVNLFQCQIVKWPQGPHFQTL